MRPDGLRVPAVLVCALPPPDQQVTAG